jgi:hypothetical protein
LKNTSLILLKKAIAQQLTLDELLLGLRALQKGSNSFGEKYKESTQRQMIKTIKPFTKFLIKKK